MATLLLSPDWRAADGLGLCMRAVGPAALWPGVRVQVVGPREAAARTVAWLKPRWPLVPTPVEFVPSPQLRPGENALVFPGAPRAAGPPAVLGDVLAVSDWLAQVHARADPPLRANPAWFGRPMRCAATVVVPTYGRSAALEALVAALAQGEPVPGGVELILVDDGSPQPPGVDLDAVPFPAALYQQANAGAASARNLALRHARGTRVVFLNDDAVPAADLVARHAALGHAREQTVGAFDLLPAHAAQPLGALVSTSTLLFAQSGLDPAARYPGRLLCTGNASLPRRLLLEIGGFEPGIPAAGGEDTELGARLYAATGVSVRVDPTLRCGHDHPQRLAGLVRRQAHMGAFAAWMTGRTGDPRYLIGDRARTESIDAAFWERVEAQLAQEDGPARLRQADWTRRLEAARSGGPAPDPQALSEAVHALCRPAFLRGALQRARHGTWPTS